MLKILLLKNKYYLDIILRNINKILRCRSMIYFLLGSINSSKFLEVNDMSSSSYVPKSQLFDKLLSDTMTKIKSGSIMILDENGLKVAEKHEGINDNDPIWGTANRLIQAGEKALRELSEQKMLSQTFETDNYYLVLDTINEQMTCAILNPKNAKQSLGLLRLHAQNIKKESNQILSV